MMPGQYRPSRRMRVRKIAAGIKGTTAALMLVCLFEVLGFPPDVTSLSGVTVLVCLFVWFACDGPAKTLAEKIQAWRLRLRT